MLRLIHHILQTNPNGKATDISLALEYLSRVQKRRSVVFLISDFQDKEYETWLQVVNQKHDLIAIVVTDPAELFLPNVGLIELEDAETNSTLLLDTGNTKTRNAYKELGQKKSEERQLLLNSNKVDQIEIRTDQSYIFPLLHFFQNRR